MGGDVILAVALDRARPGFRLQGPEGGLDRRQRPLRAQDLLQAPVDTAGAQDTGADAVIGILERGPSRADDGGRVRSAFLFNPDIIIVMRDVCVSLRMRSTFSTTLA